MLQCRHAGAQRSRARNVAMFTDVCVSQHTVKIYPTSLNASLVGLLDLLAEHSVRKAPSSRSGMDDYPPSSGAFRRCPVSSL
ncbi:hypothetical protein DOTSEDRAFT_71141 [Dothistroma septosporum NZE10]|uniref:Uncharacterized protein n=1 Tax=Dothistroma septosporum (strain NZE10 / CBS 128990) TaxID=675120 RepID=N1PQU3_DOTSN|nr:hypothetical protein DOTSEDRAFT_71141 [Dothistroma septosporum NZE10]